MATKRLRALRSPRLKSRGPIEAKLRQPRTRRARTVSAAEEPAAADQVFARLSASGGIRVWRNADRSGELISTLGGSKTWDLYSESGDLPQTVYVEGVTSGAASLTFTLVAEAFDPDPADTAVFSVVEVVAAIAEENLNPLVLLTESVAGGELWAEATYVQTESVTVAITLPSSMSAGDFLLMIQTDPGLNVWADPERTVPVSPDTAFVIQNPHYSNTFYVDPGAAPGEYQVSAKLFWIDPFTQEGRNVGEASQKAVFREFVYEGAQWLQEKAPGWVKSGTIARLNDRMDAALKPAVE